MVHNKFRGVVISIIFCASIIFPLINTQFDWVKDSRNFENRKLAECPEFDIKHLDKLPKEYDAFYNDHFFMRSIMSGWYNYLKLEIYKTSPLPDQVLIGNEGWLYLKSGEYESYIGDNYFSDSELISFKKELEFRKKYLEKRNCKFYFVVAPVKAIIYPNFIPNNIFLSAKQSHGERLIEYLNNNSDVNVLNIYDVLKEKARDMENPVYWKLDNHWNELGSFYAANEILKNINKHFSDVHQSNINEYTISKKIKKDGNIINMLHYQNDFTDINYLFKPKKKSKSVFVPEIGYTPIPSFDAWEYEMSKEIKNSKLPKALIISDSFGGGLFPFLSEHFSRTEKIFDAWQYKLNEEIVETEKPDVVILVILEAHLRSFLKFQSRLKTN